MHAKQYDITVKATGEFLGVWTHKHSWQFPEGAFLKENPHITEYQSCHLTATPVDDRYATD